MKYHNFEELPIWQDSFKIVKIVYAITNNKKLRIDSRLIDQLRGASVSIMNNIAEGFDAGSRNEFIRFLRYSTRSCSEIISMSYILKDIYHLNEESSELYQKSLSCRKQIKGFIKYLRTNNQIKN